MAAAPLLASAELVVQPHLLPSNRLDLPRVDFQDDLLKHHHAHVLRRHPMMGINTLDRCTELDLNVSLSKQIAHSIQLECGLCTKLRNTTSVRIHINQLATKRGTAYVPLVREQTETRITQHLILLLARRKAWQIFTTCYCCHCLKCGD